MLHCRALKISVMLKNQPCNVLHVIISGSACPGTSGTVLDLLLFSPVPHFTLNVPEKLVTNYPDLLRYHMCIRLGLKHYRPDLGSLSAHTLTKHKMCAELNEWNLVWACATLIAFVSTHYDVKINSVGVAYSFVMNMLLCPRNFLGRLAGMN